MEQKSLHEDIAASIRKSISTKNSSNNTTSSSIKLIIFAPPFIKPCVSLVLFILSYVHHLLFTEHKMKFHVPKSIIFDIYLFNFCSAYRNFQHSKSDIQISQRKKAHQFLEHFCCPKNQWAYSFYNTISYNNHIIILQFNIITYLA